MACKALHDPSLTWLSGPSLALLPFCRKALLSLSQLPAPSFFLLHLPGMPSFCATHPPSPFSTDTIHLTRQSSKSELLWSLPLGGSDHPLLCVPSLLPHSTTTGHWPLWSQHLAYCLEHSRCSIASWWRKFVSHKMVYNTDEGWLQTFRRKCLTKSRPEVENRTLKQGHLIALHNIPERPPGGSPVLPPRSRAVSFCAIGPERWWGCDSWHFLGWTALEKAQCGRTEGFGICRPPELAGISLLVSFSEKCRTTHWPLLFWGLITWIPPCKIANPRGTLFPSPPLCHPL